MKVRSLLAVFFATLVLILSVFPAAHSADHKRATAVRAK